jgi:hypothetical protein
VSDAAGPAPNPCESCPYRCDVPSGVWSEEEYEKLRLYDGPLWAQPHNMFQCHQMTRESDRARLCAGWVGTHQPTDLISVMIAVAQGKLDPAIFDYTTPVPLFASGNEAADHGERDIENPSEEAMDMVEKIVAKRPDVTFR